MKRYLLLFTLFSFELTLAQNFTADQLTGKAVGNLPIWTVRSGDLSAGIYLSYYSGGLKMNESERTAGMGWSLVAGGSVSREVRDLPDDLVGAMTGNPKDKRNGWLHGKNSSRIGNFSPSGNLDYSVCTDEVVDFDTLKAFRNVDTEPDIFSFNAPGLSGQFVFDNGKIIQTIPYQDLKIDLTRRGSDSLINKIVITNNTGVKYTFLAGEFTSRESPGSLGFYTRSVNLYNGAKYYYTSYYSSWYLTQIKSPEGGSIAFSYGDSFTTTTPDYKLLIDSVIHVVDTLSAGTYSVTSQLLQTITGSNEIATLTWTGNLLSYVSIKDRTYQSLTKKFSLLYKYVKGSARVPTANKVKRAFLVSFGEEINCSSFPGFRFDYYGISHTGFRTDTTEMTFNSGLGQDMFGYYNSVATSLVPDVYIRSGDTGINGERYRIAPATNYSLMGSGSGNRTVSPSKVYYGMLKQVTLPSGGALTYTYEAADYYDSLTNATILGGGARVKSLKRSANDPASDVTTSYKYCSSSNSSISSGQWTYRPMFVTFKITGTAYRVPYNIAPEEAIYYSRVEVSSTGRGKTVYEYQNTGMWGSISGDSFKAALSRIARASKSPCLSLGDLKSGYYTYPHAPNTNFDFERGLLTQVTDFRSDGKMVQRKKYTYQRTTLAVAEINAIKLDTLARKFIYSPYSILANLNNFTRTESSYLYDQISSDTTKYLSNRVTYTYNANQMLRKTASVNSNADTLYRVFKYAKDYAGTGTDTQSIMINGLNSGNRHGTLVESQSLTGTQVTGSSLTLYNNNFGKSVIRPGKQLMLGDPAGFAESEVDGTDFVYSANYFPVLFYDAYDSLGRATIIRDQGRSVKSSVLGGRNSYVALDIMNARREHVFFHDFEPYLDVSPEITGSIINTDSWSGQYSLALTNTTYVQDTVTRGVGKYYRFSCWSNASTTRTLTVSINGTSALTIAYPDSSGATGKWRYLEGRVDMSSVTAGSDFYFKLTASGSIHVDNVTFYPESSSVLAHAYEPLNGKTADLDSRGVSGFIDYDLLGRVRYLKNMDKDIVQIKDYHYKESTGVLPVSSFTGSKSPNICTSATYTANEGCGSGISYSWYVDDDLQGSASTLTYSFEENRIYRVTLVASATFGSSSTEVVITPIPVVTSSLSSSGGSNTFTCTDATFTRDLSVTLSTCFAAENITFNWYRSFNGTTNLIATTGVDSGGGSGHSYSYTSGYTYSLLSGHNNMVYCIITCTSKNGNTKNDDTVTKTTTTKTFTWSSAGPC